MSRNGVTDMFYPSEFSLLDEAARCNATWGVVPDLRRGVVEFGGRELLDHVSNIVFSNGDLVGTDLDRRAFFRSLFPRPDSPTRATIRYATRLARSPGPLEVRRRPPRRRRVPTVLVVPLRRADRGRRAPPRPLLEQPRRPALRRRGPSVRAAADRALDRRLLATRRPRRERDR